MILSLVAVLLQAQACVSQPAAQHTTAGDATPYGIGWFVAKDSLGHRYVYHGGGSVGGTTAFGVERDSRVVFALVTNLSDAWLAPGREIQAVFDSVASGLGR